MRLRVFPAICLMLVVAPELAQAQDSDHDGVPDISDVFPCDPALAGLAFAPAEGVYDHLVFEDQWPSSGDLDFNDVVLAYNYTFRLAPGGGVRSVQLTLDVLALGGIFDNGLALHLPVARESASSVAVTVSGTPTRAVTPSAADAELTLVVVEELRSLFGGASGQINSVAGQPTLDGSSVVVDVSFSTPVALPRASAPFDLFVFRVQDPSLEIHRTPYGGTSALDTARFGAADDRSAPGRWFVDVDGIPFALTLPGEAAVYPREGIALSLLFPDLVGFAQSGGSSNQNFYATNVAIENAFPGPNAPAPLGATPPAETACVARDCLLVDVDLDGQDQADFVVVPLAPLDTLPPSSIHLNLTARSFNTSAESRLDDFAMADAATGQVELADGFSTPSIWNVSGGACCGASAVSGGVGVADADHNQFYYRGGTAPTFGRRFSWRFLAGANTGFTAFTLRRSAPGVDGPAWLDVNLCRQSAMCPTSNVRLAGTHVPADTAGAAAFSDGWHTAEVTLERAACPHRPAPTCDVYVHASTTYLFCMDEPRSWTEAELYCRSRGGALAAIDSAPEWSFLDATLNAQYPYCGDNPSCTAAGHPNYAGGTIPWVGYSDTLAEGAWAWVTGEAGYDQWQRGEPNGGAGENCADFNWGGSQGYRDAYCGLARPFICEL